VSGQLESARAPHGLPGNWLWVKLGDITKFIRGVSFNSSQVQTQRESDSVLVLRGGNIQPPDIIESSDTIYVARDLVKAEQTIRAGDVAIVASTGSTAAIGKAGSMRANRDDMAIGAFLTLARPSSPALDAFFFDYFFQSSEYRERIRNLASGININNVKRAHLEETPFPLPPLPEQKRIVAKLDSMLGKIKQARELIQEARDTFANRRAAILAKAFRGELTAKWREENPDVEPAEKLLERIREEREKAEAAAGKKRRATLDDDEITEPYELPRGWKWVRLGDVCGLITSGSRGWAAHYSDSGALFVRAQDINTDELVFDNVACVNPPKGAEGVRTQIRQWDLLITITGANVARAAVVKEPLGEAYVSQHVALARPFLPELATWLHLAAINPLEGRAQLLEMAYGGGKPGLNLLNIHSLRIALPPLSELSEITRIVLQLNQIEKNTGQLLNLDEPSDSLEKSILSRAFRGELGTGNVAELPTRIEINIEERPPKRERTPRIDHKIEKTKETAAMQRNRKDPQIWNMPYLAKLIQENGANMKAAELFAVANLSLPDFYKQLDREIEQGFILEKGEWFGAK
jgi:type I restriction enzyme S subunit